MTFNTSGSTYKIWNTVPTFYYRDSKQKAVIRGNDTVVIYDGKLEVDITFNWSKTTVLTQNGTGAAFGLSDPLEFIKRLVI